MDKLKSIIQLFSKENNEGRVHSNWKNVYNTELLSEKCLTKMWEVVIYIKYKFNYNCYMLYLYELDQFQKSWAWVSNRAPQLCPYIQNKRIVQHFYKINSLFDTLCHYIEDYHFQKCFTLWNKYIIYIIWSTAQRKPVA